MTKDKAFKFKGEIIVQAKDKEEAKKYIEARLQAILKHPDGVLPKEIEELT